MRKLILISLLVFFAAPNFVAAQDNRYITNDGCIVAFTQRALLTAQIGELTNDYKKVNDLIDKGLILVLKPGVSVEIVYEREDDPDVQIRVVGNDMVFWTLKDNLLQRWFY